MATSPLAPGSEPSTMIIDKRGDVLLEIGPEGDAAVILLVSSRVLSLASTVFEAMFNHGFAEGEDLSQASPQTIPLPDDDPTQMSVLCNIVHMQTSLVPTSLTLESLADFAVLCDKYNCADSVRFYATVWISKLTPFPDANGFEKLLFATYVLDLPHEFYMVTRILILDRKSSVKIAVAKHGHDFLPDCLFDRIQEDRDKYLDQAMGAFHPEQIKRLLLKPGCSANSRVTASYVQCLDRIGVTPFEIRSIRHFHSLAEELNTMNMFVGVEQHGTNCTCQANNLKSKPLQRMRDIVRAVKGYCLDCIRKDVTGKQDLPCRMVLGPSHHLHRLEAR